MTRCPPTSPPSVSTGWCTTPACRAEGLNLGRGGQEQLTRLKEKLEATKVKLENNDFGTLGKDDLVGDLLNTTALTYHAELGAMNHITAKTMQVNALTLPSETIFATKLKVLTLFGIPRYVQAGGLSMDADHLMQVAKAKDGNADTVKQYMLGSGMTSSALEHSVPEQLFSTPDNPAEAISTVKALQIANNQGIPIYTVNQSNLAAVLPQLQIDSQIKTDIQNAVNAGKVVTVSKSNISFNGWNGCGYIITDPETGAGAYMISGGASGGIVLIVLAVLLLFFFWPALVAIGAFAIFLAGNTLAGYITGVILGLTVGLILSQVLSNSQKDDIKQLFDMILEISLPFLEILNMTASWYIALAALIISTVFEILKKYKIITSNIRTRKYFYDINILEA